MTLFHHLAYLILPLAYAERVAIALEGPAGRLLPEALASIHRHVIQQFRGCDVFVVSPYRLAEHENEQDKRIEILKLLAPLGRLTAYDIQPDMSSAELREFFISSLPSDADTDRMLNYFSDYRLVDDHWVRTDSIQGERNIRYFLNKRSLYIMLQRHERDNGFQYDRVIFQRADMFYYAAHPPLQLLSNRYVWIPEGQDWAGLNDRHAVLPREHAERYLLRWNHFISGELPQWYQLTEWSRSAGVWNEMYLFLAMSSLRGLRDEIKVARFLPVAHVKCCTSGPQCSNRPCQDRSKGWRYQNEGLDSLKVAALLEQGWHWQVVRRGERGARVFQPGCFDGRNTPSGDDARRCCDESVYIGGPTSCWPEGSEILSFDTCCRPDHPQLSLRPPEGRRDFGNVCWALQSATTADTYFSCISKGMVSPERVAVCVVGPSDMHAPNMEVGAQVVGPLGADLFVVVNKYRPSLPWTYDAEKTQGHLSHYGRIAASRGFDSLEGAGELIKGLIEDRASNPEFLLHRTGGLIHVNGRFSKGLWEIMAKQECYALIADYERQHGFRYDRIVSLRENFLMRSEHPPLHLMSDQYLWLSEGGDGFGLNDRHAVRII